LSAFNANAAFVALVWSVILLSNSSSLALALLVSTSIAAFLSFTSVVIASFLSCISLLITLVCCVSILVDLLISFDKLVDIVFSADSALFFSVVIALLNSVSAARAVSASFTILLFNADKLAFSSSESMSIVITLSSLMFTSLPGLSLLIRSL